MTNIRVWEHNYWMPAEVVSIQHNTIEVREPPEIGSLWTINRQRIHPDDLYLVQPTHVFWERLDTESGDKVFGYYEIVTFDPATQIVIYQDAKGNQSTRHVMEFVDDPSIKYLVREIRNGSTVTAAAVK